MKSSLVTAIAVAVLFLGGLTAWALHSRHTAQPKPNKATSTTHTTNSTTDPTSIATKPSAPTPPTTAGIQNSISQQISDPSLQAAGFSVDSFTEAAPTWYIVHVTPTGTDSEIALLRQNEDSSLTLVDGPSSQLSLSTLRSFNVPQAVMTQLPIYDDTGN